MTHSVTHLTHLSFTFRFVYDFQGVLHVRRDVLAQPHHREVPIPDHPTHRILLPQRQRQNNIVVFAQFYQKIFFRRVRPVFLFIRHFRLRPRSVQNKTQSLQKKDVNTGVFYPFLRPGGFLCCCMTLLSSNSSSKSSEDTLSLP